MTSERFNSSGTPTRLNWRRCGGARKSARSCQHQGQRSAAEQQPTRRDASLISAASLHVVCDSPALQPDLTGGINLKDAVNAASLRCHCLN